MRNILLVLTGFGVLFMIARFWQTADDLQATIDAVNRQVDSLERTIQDLSEDTRHATGS